MKTTIITPTPHLPSSIEFYRKLSFKIIEKQSQGVVTDGIAVIEIVPDRFVRPGVKFYGVDLKLLESKENFFDFQQGKAIRDPNGVWIYLTDKLFEYDFTVSKTCFGLTGNFSGISIETDSIPSSVNFWQQFGFKKHGGNEAHGYVTLMNEDNVCCISCFRLSSVRPSISQIT
jgi:hypothetical protein